jgi:hypothetical protein
MPQSVIYISYRAFPQECMLLIPAGPFADELFAWCNQSNSWLSFARSDYEEREVDETEDDYDCLRELIGDKEGPDKESMIKHT